MTRFRVEHDMLGSREVPADALWGVHTLRAIENFPMANRPVHRRLVHAFGAVKWAALTTNHEIGALDDERYAALEQACRELADGSLDEHIVVDALQGGAGTSTNMNVNEVLANRAIQILGGELGGYSRISPTDDVNRHQSTNDTYPTALKVAAIEGVRELEAAIVRLVEAFQRKEAEFADIVKIARTQLQDAVLTTLGRDMSAMAEAFSRDRWRIYKCEERLRVVNLGGTAIGSGLGAPRRYIFRAVERLREFTGFGLARAENLVDATRNADALAETSGFLKTLATNLLKASNDLRFMASGPKAGLGEIQLPQRQAGSSIMPGKVNPVICEAVGQAAIAAMGHDQIVTHAASAGNLALNQFMPLIADSLLTSIDLLIGACDILARRCVEDMTPLPENMARQLNNSTAVVTALVERIGYERACRLAADAIEQSKPVRELAIEQSLCTAEEFDAMTTPESVSRLGSADSA